MQTLQTLLEAYDYEDADGARAALNSPFIKHMDTEYAKLARGLPLPQQEYTVSPAGVRPNAAPSYVSVKSTVEADVNQVRKLIFYNTKYFWIYFEFFFFFIKEVLTLAALTGKASISSKPVKTDEESLPTQKSEDKEDEPQSESSQFEEKCEESQSKLEKSPTFEAESPTSNTNEDEDDEFGGNLCWSHNYFN